MRLSGAGVPCNWVVSSGRLITVFAGSRRIENGPFLSFSKAIQILTVPTQAVNADWVAGGLPRETGAAGATWIEAG